MDQRGWQLATLLLILLLTVKPVSADSIPWARHTVTVPLVVEQAVGTALLENQVPGASYYAITDVSMRGLVYMVSIAAIGQCEPQSWNLDCAVRLFTAAYDGETAALEGTPEYDFMTSSFMRDYHQINPSAQTHGTEGGEDGDYPNLPVLPFRPGTKVLIGPRGVHDAGYSLTGWKAVDLVSGTDMGGNAAPNEVYASVDSEITYVCRDDHSVAVRAGNFLYAHLMDNANLTVGYDLKRGVKFASMVIGSFSDTCGWASQQPNHWHLHFAVPGTNATEFSGWLFKPFEGMFISSNGERIGTGDYLTNWTTTSDGSSGDPGEQIKQGNSFWDSIVAGLINFVRSGVLSRFDKRTNTDYASVYVNASGVVLRIFFILFSTSFKLHIFAFVVTAMMILEPARIIYKLYIAIKKAIPFV